MQEPTFLILTGLAAGPQHGYGIITDAEQISGGVTRLQTGTLYMALDRLRSAGLVEPDREEVADGRLRRYYRLTDEGAALLGAETERRRASAAVAAQRLRVRLPRGTPGAAAGPARAARAAHPGRAGNGEPGRLRPGDPGPPDPRLAGRRRRAGRPGRHEPDRPRGGAHPPRPATGSHHRIRRREGSGRVAGPGLALSGGVGRGAGLAGCGGAGADRPSAKSRGDRVHLADARRADPGDPGDRDHAAGP